MRRFAFLLSCVLLIPSLFAGEQQPTDADLAGITYFAPLCPFFYRMMTPSGELLEFQQRKNGRFLSPPGWAASQGDGEVCVRDPKRRRYHFRHGRLVRYENGDRKLDITYPFEPMYEGKPALPWEGEASEYTQEEVQGYTDIWKKNMRFRLWFTSPNVAAALLAEIAIVACWVFLFCGRWPSIAGALALLGSLAGLAMTSSRGGILAFGVGLAVMLFLAWFRRRVRPLGRRVRILFVCLVAFAAFAVVTQGIHRFTGDFKDTIVGTGKSQDRSTLVWTGLRMIADAPGGWGIHTVGPAYSDWYQAMGGNKWQLTMVSDQLTHVVGYGWCGRWLWMTGWLLALSLLFNAARLGRASAGVAVWTALFVASCFNDMLGVKVLWVLPIAYALWTMGWKPWVYWRSQCCCILGSATVAAVLCAALYAVCSSMPETTPSIRYDGKVVVVNGNAPRVWVVDDRQMLGGVYAKNLLRRFCLNNKGAPAIAYVTDIRDVPKAGVERLLISGLQCAAYLELAKAGEAPEAKDLVFVSPLFGPMAVPSSLPSTCRFRMLVGEFAARYVDVYGEAAFPDWVVKVKGAELYIPDWPERLMGDLVVAQ